MTKQVPIYRTWFCSDYLTCVTLQDLHDAPQVLMSNCIFFIIPGKSYCSKSSTALDYRRNTNTLTFGDLLDEPRTTCTTIWNIHYTLQARNMIRLRSKGLTLDSVRFVYCDTWLAYQYLVSFSSQFAVFALKDERIYFSSATEVQTWRHVYHLTEFFWSQSYPDSVHPRHLLRSTRLTLIRTDLTIVKRDSHINIK